MNTTMPTTSAIFSHQDIRLELRDRDRGRYSDFG
jgi:hypothetical protein